MWTRTLRGKLTLWNLGVLTLTLLLFGLILNYTNRQRLAASIDSDVLQRAFQAAKPPPPRPPGPDGEGNPDDPFGPGRPPAPPEERGPPGDPFDNLHRPERFSREGTLLGPNERQVFSAELLTQALSGKTVIGYATLDGVHLRVAAVPILDGGQVDGAVETARELTDFDALDRSQMLTLLVLVPLALLVGGLGALFLTNKALKPVAEATAAAEKISETELSTRLQVQGKDELAQLSSTFNGMLDRLQASFEKQRQAFADLARAYENQRRFTADASHELRTPLTRLKLATGSALSEAGLPPFVIEPLHIADQSADSMSKIVNQLLLLSKADAGQLGLVLAPLDLRIVVAEASDTMPKRTPPLEVSLPDNPVTVNGDEDHLRRVVLNLLQNAYRHTPEGKPILLIVRAEGPNAVLRVSDQGVGVSDEHLEHLGKRFYRVDDSRTGSEQGVGLGLSICKSIIESLGGTLSFESGQGEGLSVTVRIPLKA